MRRDLTVLFLMSFLMAIGVVYAQDGPSFPEGGSEVKLSPSDEGPKDLKKQAEEARQKILKGSPQFSLVGKVERGRSTDFAINGEDFIVDGSTNVNGEFEVGKWARVRGDRVNGVNQAKKIAIASEKPASKATPVKDDRYRDYSAPKNEPAGLPDR